MEFTKIYTIDWNGKLGEYDIINLIEREKGLYTCAFRNSSGDIEVKAANDQELYQK